MTRFAGLLGLRGQPAGELVAPTVPRIAQRTAAPVLRCAADPAVAVASADHALLQQGGLLFVGDVRLDGRDDLSASVDDGTLTLEVSDAALVLKAFRRLGPTVVDHLQGDFAFGIWDAAARGWFCARDQFGIKPLYYIANGTRFGFANTVDALRFHVDDCLNEGAIADFLLAGINPDLSSSSFEHIHMLPPAHTLCVGVNGQPRTMRYWSLASRTRHRRDTCILAEFEQHFEAATRERLPAIGAASVALSGGLDSSAVAAFAVRRAGGCPIRAITLDDARESYTTHEATAAQLTAAHLRIEHIVLPHGQWSPPQVGGTEVLVNAANPVMGIPGSATDRRFVSTQHCGRVVLTGHGADPLFTPDIQYLNRLIRRGAIGEVLSHWWAHIKTFRRRPPVYLHTARLQAKLRARALPMPPWLDADFARRVELSARSVRLTELLAAGHPAAASDPGTRAGAIAQLSGPFWPRLFESLDDARHQAEHIEFRHPWFDLRVVDFMLAIPESPWCHDKHLLREVLRGRVPEPVRVRPKALVVEEPEHQMLRPHYQRWGEELLARTPLGEFIDKRKFTRLLAQAHKLRPHEYALLARPLFLGNWLAHVGYADAR